MILKKLTIEKYLQQVSSSSPTPGGGSVAAITSATAAALVEMVANLTIGKKDYKKVESRMKVVAKDTKKLREKFLKLADEDSIAFEDVMKSFKISKETKGRSRKIEKAFIKAAKIPLETATLSKKILDLAKEAQKTGNKNAMSDAKVAIHLAKAGAGSALENVKINILYIKDKSTKTRLEQAVARLAKF